MAQINWTPQASDDLQNIIDFFAAQSSVYAKIQAKRIIDKIRLLKNFPELGRIVPELEYKNVREIIVGSYRIIYHNVSKTRIDILTIHHTSQQLNISDL